MFGKEDNTYNELRENSIMRWLDELSQHDDVLVRGGTELTRDYINDLKRVIQSLEKKNQTKDDYLRKLKTSK